MARTNNLTNFLTDVSSAIKQKTGDNTPIPASDFDTEILSIETGGNYQSKTLNVTQNGNYNLLPDQEFDAISNVSISVSVNPVLQNKTITENGSYTADQNYDGLGTVIVNVQGSTINNQDKTITQNGTYTADSGYTGLGEVTVNVPGEEINNQNKTVTENGTYTADSGYTGLGTVIVNVPQTGGQTQLVYQKNDWFQPITDGSVTNGYGFTQNGTNFDSNTKTKQGKTVSDKFSYVKMYVYSDGVTPITITYSTKAYSTNYLLISKPDIEIPKDKNYNQQSYCDFYYSKYESFSGTATLPVMLPGIHFITIKHVTGYISSSTTATGYGCTISSTSFKDIDETVTVYATDNTTDMESLSPLEGSLCVVHDDENRVYRFDGTNWTSITKLNDAIKLFSSINEMQSTEGLLDENAVVYGEDWGNFVRPTSSTTVYEDIAFKVSGTYQYTGEGSPEPMSITSNTTSVQYLLWAYGDVDEWGELWEYEEYAPTAPNTMNLLVIRSWSVERVIHYTSTDGINYTTSDLTEPLLVEQAGVNSYTDAYKSSMLLGKVPAFYGMFTYRTGINPELFQGKPFNYANDTTISTANLKKLIDITCDWLEAHPEDDTTIVSPLTVGSSVVVTTSDFVTYKLYKELLAYDQTSRGLISSLFVQPNNDINFFAEYYLAYDKTHLQYTCLTVNTQTGVVTRENGIANGVEVTYLPTTSSTETKTGHIYNTVTNGDWITSLTLNKSTYENESRSTSISSRRANGVGGSTSFVTVTAEKWWPADTQLSALKTSDLYNGVTAYGHDGIVSGDSSWQNNITDMIKLQNYMPNILTSTVYGISNSGKHCLFGDTTTRTENYNTTPTKAITRYIAEDDTITDEHIMLARLNNSFDKNALYSPDGNWKITFSTTSTVLTINITNTITNTTNTHTINRTSSLYVYTTNFHLNNDCLAVIYSTASGTIGISKIVFDTNILTSTTISHSFGTSISNARIYYHKKYNTFYATLERSSSYGGVLFRIVDNGNSLTGTNLVSNTWSNTFSYNAVRFAPDGTVYYFYGGSDACWGKKINGSTGSIITSYSFGTNTGLRASEQQTVYSLPRILENNDGFVIGSTLYSKSNGAIITNTNNYYYPNVTDINEYYGVTISPYGLPSEYDMDDWNGTSCIIYNCSTDTKYTLYANICLPVGVADNVVITGGETIENVSVSTDNIDIIFFNNNSSISNTFGITATVTSATEATYENSTHLIVPSAVFRNGLYSQYIISPLNNNLGEVTNSES